LFGGFWTIKDKQKFINEKLLKIEQQPNKPIGNNNKKKI
jgi:hypothetical protein